MPRALAAGGLLFPGLFLLARAGLRRLPGLRWDEPDAVIVAARCGAGEGHGRALPGGVPQRLRDTRPGSGAAGRECGTRRLTPPQAGLVHPGRHGLHGRLHRVQLLQARHR